MKMAKSKIPVIRDIRENGLCKKSETKISAKSDPDWDELREGVRTVQKHV